MGSRAVVVVCRDEDAARARFGVEGEGIGVCVTRTGRRFFDDAALESQFLGVVRDALTGSGLWDELGSDWVCLDCELMPWSAKAQALIREQYAAVGAAATAALPQAVAALRQASGHTPGLEPLLEKFGARETTAGQFVDAYRRYCWPVHSLSDLKLAPFHLLASEGGVHMDRDHGWHMATLARLCAADTSGLLLATPHRTVDVTDPESVTAGIRWWEELTEKGGEGMVVKPWDFITRGPRGLAQPAVKCRGREYLRIIYGPDYDAPENLSACAHAAWPASAPWPGASSPWASRRWNDSSAASRCAASTSASSPCWPWKANP